VEEEISSFMVALVVLQVMIVILQQLDVQQDVSYLVMQTGEK
jgi:hypothetical protein